MWRSFPRVAATAAHQLSCIVLPRVPRLIRCFICLQYAWAVADLADVNRCESLKHSSAEIRILT